VPSARAEFVIFARQLDEGLAAEREALLERLNDTPSVDEWTDGRNRRSAR
jgi:hypothetical protein